MAFVVVGFRETEKVKLFWGATAAESRYHPTLHQDVRNRNLFRDVKWMVQVETDDCRSQADLLGPPGHVQCKQQRGRHMPEMCMGVVLGKPRILHSELICNPNQVGHFLKNRSRRLV